MADKVAGAVVRGGSTANNLAVMHAIHLESRAKDTLEVGLAYGVSAAVFAESHKVLGMLPTGQHFAIDPFQRLHLADAGLNYLAERGLEEYVTWLEEFSDSALPRLVAEDRHFDLIYVDGSHLFEDVFLDAWYCTRLLRTGGIVLFDDCADLHVKKVLAFFRANMRHALAEIDVAPYRPDLGRSLKYKVARAIGRTQLAGFRKVSDDRRPWTSKLAKF